MARSISRKRLAVLSDARTGRISLSSKRKASPRNLMVRLAVLGSGRPCVQVRRQRAVPDGGGVSSLSLRLRPEISMLAAYLLLGARRNVVPLVLAETLIRLDLVCTGQTMIFGGSPLLLQVNSQSAHLFLVFRTFCFYLNTQLRLYQSSLFVFPVKFYMAPYLSFHSCSCGCQTNSN
ncbi:hypothetical protein RHMOL_Rhmol04G0218900 [Rhododendron molle]|uniref:Uncharacterized protein n=1 Tax=Rhododendron molle TaxID=49168 RepID=A0ACC0P5I9_RHOML|nr:hypothetical protein RHMOL_Rhmol04G0218900 [Rhododendron molle]